jgi:hypothetical protein
MTREVEELFRQQLEAWPLLQRGLSGLAESKTRTVLVDGDEILLRHIPHRVASTTAAVDGESIRKRPCFLCPENLFPQQAGLPFGPDFTMYCNPFPVVERHLTIVHREHRPQRIAGQIGSMLDLAVALPGSFVIYNGPQCGASAPDHLHLQAGSREGLPIARHASGPGPAIESHGVRALLFRGKDRSLLSDQTDSALEILSAVTGKGPEPWVNLAVFHESDGWKVIVFPRDKHRPQAFHTGELTVSPATIDMCGILVTPVFTHFERACGDDIAAVFREVTLPLDPFNDVVFRLGRS